MDARLLGALIFWTIAVCARAAEKRWLPDLDWNSPSNWLDGLVPDLDSRVVFPTEMRHAVGMARTSPELRYTGLELPRDGVLALPEDGKIFLNDQSKSLPGKTSRWLHESPYFWVDPLNWAPRSVAAPHLERLPCQSDVVVLPASSRTFSMRLPETRVVEVTEVRLADDNESLARWEWRAMSDRAEFLGGSFSVKYSPLMGCENCRCQEGDITGYIEEICDVQRPRCGLLACDYPLKVEGHCCFYCGGRIKLSRKVLLSTAQRVARRVLKSREDLVDWHSRVTWDEDVEILITEKGVYEGSNTVIAIAEVEAALKEEELEVVYTEISGGPLYDNRLLMALGSFFGTLIVVISLVLITCPAFGYSFAQVWEAVCEVTIAICIDSRSNGSKKKKTFAFARFENLSEGNVQLAEDETEESNAQSVNGERFENPLYRSQSQSRGAQGKVLDLNEPVSLAGLEKAIELDQMESIEMDIENL